MDLTFYEVFRMSNVKAHLISASIALFLILSFYYSFKLFPFQLDNYTGQLFFIVAVFMAVIILFFYNYSLRPYIFFKTDFSIHQSEIKNKLISKYSDIRPEYSFYTKDNLYKDACIFGGTPLFNAIVFDKTHLDTLSPISAESFSLKKYEEAQDNQMMERYILLFICVVVAILAKNLIKQMVINDIYLDVWFVIPVLLIIYPLMNWVSKKHEYTSDLFSARHVGKENFIS